MKDGVTIKLVVQEPYGGKTHVMAFGSNEFPIFSERMVEDMRGGFSPLNFDQTVRVLKERTFRRNLLTAAAKNLAERMADYLEDSEGWHGDRRRELLKSRKID